MDPLSQMLLEHAHRQELIANVWLGVTVLLCIAAVVTLVRR